YPGVDLVYYGNQGQLEYDFLVAPGADPRAIRLALRTANRETGNSKLENRNSKLVNHQSSITNRQSGDAPLQIAAHGDLIVKTTGGEVRFHKPVAYQTNARGGRDTVEARYVLRRGQLRTADHQSAISFELGPYDHQRALVVDPALNYSTYLGGGYV